MEEKTSPDLNFEQKTQFPSIPKFNLIVGSFFLILILIYGYLYFIQPLSIKSEFIHLDGSNNVDQINKNEEIPPPVIIEPTNIPVKVPEKYVNILNYKTNTLSEGAIVEYGSITEGKYRDYDIFSIPGGPFLIFIATKDYKKFIIDGDPDMIDCILSKKSFGNLFVNENIEKVDYLFSEFPEIIKVNDDFGLLKGSMYSVTEQIDSEKGEYVTKYQNDLSKEKKLMTRNNINFYEINSNFKYDAYGVGSRDSIKNTSIIATNKYGLGFKYNMILLANLDKYNSNKIIEKQKNIDFCKSTSDDSPGSEFVWYENLPVINSSEITTREPLFSKYSTYPMDSCGGFSHHLIVNKSDIQSDLRVIGKYRDRMNIYSLKDKNNNLNEKFIPPILSYTLSEEGKEGSSNNSNMFFGNKITKQDFISKNPIIYIDDPWGNLIMLYQFDYVYGVGCGKPVIYLYPEKPTEVRVTFPMKMNFQIDIPKYASGWKVLAHPDGKLFDLQPEKTDCNSIDYSKTGLEYAKKSCENKTYPYLFWAGQGPVDQDYPDIDTGWIVEKKNIDIFLREKLRLIGLSNVEIDDMMEYWLPQMNNKNAPYYRISLIQSPQMNQFIPMNIQPKPDTLIRVFLDYLPLKQKPTRTILAPKIYKIERKGFTVVEWGGLKI